MALIPVNFKLPDTWQSRELPALTLLFEIHPRSVESNETRTVPLR
jgi:hypothetical protein